jgi:hypothetical protein
MRFVVFLDNVSSERNKMLHGDIVSGTWCIVICHIGTDILMELLHSSAGWRNNLRMETCAGVQGEGPELWGNQ